MTADEDDLDDDWDVFLKDIPIPEEYPFKKDLDEAAEVTKKEIIAFVDGLGHQPLNGETFGNIIAKAVHVFLACLQDRLKRKDLVGLIGVVLEGQGLNPEELKGFVRALPDKMIDRMVTSVLTSASGIQALLAIEWHFREGNLLADYSLGVTALGRMYAKIPQPNDEEIVLFLDDQFDGIPPKPEITDEYDSSPEVGHPTDSSSPSGDVEST